MSNVDAVIVAKNLEEILPETIKGLKTYSFKKAIAVVAKDSAKPKWCDTLAVDKGKLGKARNTGADLTDAEYICMVDADIVLTPKYIDKLLKYFDDPKVAAAGGKLESATRSLYALTKAQIFRGYCKSHSDLPCGGTIYRAEPLKKTRFNDTLSGGEDHELHMRLKKRGCKVVFVDKISCLHHFKGNMRKEVFLCMLSGARTGLMPCFVRAVVSPLRSILLVIACRDNIHSFLIPPFYVTQWIAHVFGAFFMEKEIKAKMATLR
jgi:cellulose synthase/poly-beta-1,6-N-acetylglucosamine synthase-like glycosyltransferase